MNSKSNIDGFCQKGDSITVIAQHRNNLGNVNLEKGQEYKFEIKEIEKWKDGCKDKNGVVYCSHPNINPWKGWLPNTKSLMGKYLNCYRKKCYEPEAAYMELVGEVGGDHFRIGEVAGGEDLAGKKHTISGSYVATKSGQLIVRANDPVKDKLFFKFYKNNRGKLKLTVYEKVSD